MLNQEIRVHLRDIVTFTFLLQYFVVIIHYDTALAFGGDSDTPAAYTEISSIGAIGGDKNAKIVEAIAAVAEMHLGIPHL